MNTKLMHFISFILFAVATFLFFFSGTLNTAIIVAAIIVEVGAWVVLYFADVKKAKPEE